MKELEEQLLQLTCGLGDSPWHDEQLPEMVGLLGRGADPNVRDWLKQTPLVWAARRGFDAVVRELLKAGAHTEAEDINARTPLIHAAAYGHLGAVQALLEKGANTSATDPDGVTALIWAASFGHLEVVNALLGAKADVNLADKRGCTPLSWAARFGHLTVIDALLEAGADKEIATTRAFLWEADAVPSQEGSGGADASSGRQAATAPESTGGAVDAGEVAAVGDMDASARGETTDTEEEEAVAANAGTEQPTDVQSTEPAGCTPLMIAAGWGRENVVRKLLERKANVEARDENGCTPLMWAARCGQRKIASALLAEKADVNAADKDGRTPLMWATTCKDVFPMVKLLICAGADVRAVDKGGHTPLMWAAASGDVGVLQMLLKRGANVNTASKDRLTALMVAQQYRNAAVVNFLQWNGAIESHFQGTAGFWGHQGSRRAAAAAGASTTHSMQATDAAAAPAPSATRIPGTYAAVLGGVWRVSPAASSPAATWPTQAHAPGTPRAGSPARSASGAAPPSRNGAGSSEVASSVARVSAGGAARAAMPASAAERSSAPAASMTPTPAIPIPIPVAAPVPSAGVRSGPRPWSGVAAPQPLVRPAATPPASTPPQALVHAWARNPLQATNQKCGPATSGGASNQETELQAAPLRLQAPSQPLGSASVGPRAPSPAAQQQIEAQARAWAQARIGRGGQQQAPVQSALTTHLQAQQAAVPAPPQTGGISQGHQPAQQTAHLAQVWAQAPRSIRQAAPPASPPIRGATHGSAAWLHSGKLQAAVAPATAAALGPGIRMIAAPGQPAASPRSFRTVIPRAVPPPMAAAPPPAAAAPIGPAAVAAEAVAQAPAAAMAAPGLAPAGVVLAPLVPGTPPQAKPITIRRPPIAPYAPAPAVAESGPASLAPALAWPATASCGSPSPPAFSRHSTPDGSSSSPGDRGCATSRVSTWTCPLCEVGTSRWALLTCKHRGPCEQCCPMPADVVSAYPACKKCGAATELTKIIKLRLA